MTISIRRVNSLKNMESTEPRIIIRKASRSDARAISDAIIEAVGDEITLGFAGSPERVPLVRRLFTELAACDDSQYSYRNSLIAETPDGSVAGVIISYDGADLPRLRMRFIEKTKEILGYDINPDEMTDEASPDEIYLDSLCVFGPFRGRGIARRLIEEAVASHASSHKPAGLLVDYDNEKARRLYERIGFRQVGDTPFAGTLMAHLMRP